ncbi:MAG: nucleotidyltransferase family protein [Limnohabitans sp.]
MNSPQRSLLVQLLRRPASCLDWQDTDWELLLKQARRANLLPRVAELLGEAGLFERLPQAPRDHLVGARLLSASQLRAVQWEARQIGHALQELGAPVVLLKGAAYALDGLPPAAGRIFSDIDILVPREKLASTEAALMLEGWHGVRQDAYDDQYYRRWMHEIPPMTHVLRETVIDVHHNILPPSGRIKVDARRFLERLHPLAAYPGLYRLDDADLVLHSACHLFLDGEFDKGLRDLADLDALLRHFATLPGFWPALLARARELGLARMLLYALRYTHAVLDTPQPAAALMDELQTHAPPPWLLRLMDAVFLRALAPDHPSCADRWTAPARGFLYLRAHWMRMPLPLLAMHLTIKAFKRAPEPT